MLPFNREQFVAVFATYNEAVWPAQLVAYLVGATVVAMLARPLRWRSRAIGVALAAMWIWTGIVYHGLFFSAINKAAPAFGAMFVLQGIGWLVAAATGRLEPGGGRLWPDRLGWAMVGYALLVYPLLGMAAGHRYPGMPMFGITPCPVTILSFGVLLLARATAPRWLLLAPFVWSLIGGSAAFLLGVPQDWVLLVSGVATVPIVLGHRRGGGAPPRGGRVSAVPMSRSDPLERGV